MDLLSGTESALGLEEQRRLEGMQRGERNMGETSIIRNRSSKTV